MSQDEARRFIVKRCRELNQELREHPEDFKRYGELGSCLEGVEGRLEDAMGYYLEELERRPYFASSYHLVANSHSKLGQYDMAIHEARRGLSLDRKNPVSHHVLAFLLEKAGEWNEALTEYREVLEWIKEHGEGARYGRFYSTDRYKREDLQLTINRLEKKVVEEVVSEQPPPPQLENEAKARMEAGSAKEEYASYCQDMDSQVKMMPKDSRRQLARAFCLIHSGDLAGAESAFLSALEQDAGNPYLYLFIANHYLNQRQPSKAVSELRRGLGQTARGNPVIQYRLAQAYEDVGRFKEAGILYKQVLSYAKRRSGKGKSYFIEHRGEAYPTTALTLELIQERLAYVEGQLGGENKQ